MTKTINTPFSWDLFREVPVVGIVRNIHFEDFKEVLKAAQQAGLTCLEVTMNTPEVEKLIDYAKEQVGNSMNVGAGTVCSMSDLHKAIAAGSQFIVTPILSEELIQECVSKGIPIFPGAYTPSEIYKAFSLGAQVVKVFPATALGPSFLKDLKGPLPQIELLPTGGVDLKNLKDFKNAGAAGFGIGGSLFKKSLIEAKDWQALTEHIRAYILETKTLYHHEN